MKVLLITDNHTRSGGAEHYFFDLKDRLKKNGLAVYSLGFGSQPCIGKDEIIFQSLESSVAKMIWRIWPNRRMYRTIRAHINKIQPDIIHIHNLKQHTHAVLKAVEGYPVVQTIHDYGTVCPVGYNIHKNGLPCPSGFKLTCFWQHQVKFNRAVYLAMVYAFYRLRKALKKTVRHYFAPSPQLVSALLQQDFKPASVALPFKTDAQPYSFEKLNPTHFLFAGNLGAHKGIDVLLEEFALAYQHNEALTLTIAGTGSDENRLQKKINRLGLTHCIKMIGWKTDLHNEYEKCAAVIFPSLWIEAFGLVITEAMAHARPVIGSDRGSPPWLIDDQITGLIFNPLVKGDLASKILLLANQREKIQKLGRNGYAKLEKLIDNEASLHHIITIYKNVINEAAKVQKGAKHPFGSD